MPAGLNCSGDNLWKSVPRIKRLEQQPGKKLGADLTKLASGRKLFGYIFFNILFHATAHNDNAY
jgi:hypothetical protein